MLHVAPEPQFEDRLRRIIGRGYITADLYREDVMVKMNICDIQNPDEYFDMIYCCHVLEHVNDDRLAMREFYRVLKAEGWAILLVPVDREITIEDPSVTDPGEREKLFGQNDHVRAYGPDYLDRLKDSGFEVSLISPSSFLSKQEMTLMGITKEAGDIYFCRKMASHANQGVI